MFAGLVVCTTFATLKIAHQLAWSWVWVVLPIWLPGALVGCAVLAIGIFVSVGDLVERLRQGRDR